jgi:hypothetical protein
MHTFGRLVPLVVATLSACATGRPTLAANRPGDRTQARDRTAIQRLIADARVSVDSGVRAGSLAPLLSLIDDSTLVILPRGDTLRGRAPIAEALAREQAARRAGAVQVSVARYVECIDGGLEWGARYVVPRGSEYPDTLRGPYAVRWILEGDGSLRMRQLRLGSAAHDAAFRRACVANVWTSLSDPRLTIWVPVLWERWATVSDLSERLRGMGYGNGRLDDQIDYSGNSEPRQTRPAAVGVRYQFGAPIALDVIASVPHSRSRTEGYDAENTTHISISQASRYAGTALSVRWRFIRVGAGPLVVFTEWDQRETDVYRGAGFWFLRGPPTEESWQSTDVGMMLFGSLSAPVTSSLTIDAVSIYRGGVTSEIRATPRRAATKASVGGVGIGLALGVHF